jgi:site-specific DNA-methyltransferase (adenine-specific)
MKPYFEFGGISIYHGDSREILPKLGRFDLLLTDPPYGINADRDRNCAKNGWVDYGSSGWDKEPVSDELLALCRSKAEASVIWGGNYFDLPISMGWLVWDKGQRDFSLADGELAWTDQNRALRIFTFSRAAALQDGRSHPTQKPLVLMKWCLTFFPLAKSVLDPFMGSGTTLRAAKDAGLTAVGIEREEKYCEIAAKRMAQEVMEFV